MRVSCWAYKLLTWNDYPFSTHSLQVILMAGLQGVGKTTACGKLANHLKKQNRKVLLVATDVYRPAAIEQLHLVGQRVGVEVFDLGQNEKPVNIAKQGLEKARKEEFDTIIVDTAGRLQVKLIYLNVALFVGDKYRDSLSIYRLGSEEERSKSPIP